MGPLCANLVARTALFQKQQDLLLQLVLSEAPSLYVHAENRQHRSVSGIRSGVLLIPDGQKPNAPMQWLQQHSVWELLSLSDQQSIMCALHQVST